MGDWEPTAERFAQVISAEHTRDDESRPYPFFLATPLEAPPESLGDVADWQVEWKWDGIRAQMVRRSGHIYLWSRGEELITSRFPEVATAASSIADGTVLDGEVLAWRGERPLPFAELQQRIGRRKNVAQMALVAPAVFMAYDLLEQDGRDIRTSPQHERRAWLETLLSSRHDASAIRISPLVSAENWATLATLRDEARDRGVEGFMLKHRASAYGTGRKKGAWWKWKIAPLTIDAVLIYAQPGSGKRASLLTDYTFGLWDNGELVPVAKAYSGMSNEEIAELDRWIRTHTRERFGPVRLVEPVHVFELGFEGVLPSSRHKSGVAVRFPRMLRWRRDKTAEEADTVESLKALIRS
jgi:DNA ligase-1